MNAHFGRTMPILFMHLTPNACARARQRLGMREQRIGLWLDNLSPDETQKRITILPDKMNDESKIILTRLFGNNLAEIDNKFANELLVRSSPKDNVKARAAFIQQNAAHSASSGGIGTPAKKSKEASSIDKYCQFPLTGGTTVTTDDYVCLEDESFLNDVIIDFYLRFLQFSMMGEADRDRTHVFSTFFYNRLTTRPKPMKNRLHPIEDNQNLSAPEKRYERVKRWTKKINLFDKDFIVVPINEQ